jgi:hypothetical protein
MHSEMDCPRTPFPPVFGLVLAVNDEEGTSHASILLVVAHLLYINELCA